MRGTQPAFLSVAMLVALLAMACSGNSYGKETPSNGKHTQLGSLSANDHGTKDASKLGTIELEADNFYFSPTFIRGTAGQKLTLKVANESGTTHNFSAAALSLTKDIPAKGKVEMEVTFPQSGVVLFFCKYHTGSGMNGELLVGDAMPQAASSTTR